MLERKDINVRARLARRLLRWGTRLVQHTALYGLVIYAIGCVIPTPLDRAPSPTNYSPVFVANRVSPEFGPMTAQVGQPRSFTLAATDPNLEDTLLVRFYTKDSAGSPLFSGIQGQLNSAKDPEDPTLRLGTIDAAPCPLGQLQGVTFDYYVVVADRDFTMPTKVAEGGLSDTNHWELTCM